jgi:hypothetical protein
MILVSSNVSVTVMTDYGLDVWDKISSKSRNFSLLHQVNASSGAQAAPQLMRTVGNFPGESSLIVKLIIYLEIVLRMCGAVNHALIRFQRVVLSINHNFI